MNRQVLPSMLLSVLIVCAFAVALRPIEGDRRPEPDPAEAAPVGPSTEPPALPSPSESDPEAEATETDAESEADDDELEATDLEPPVEAPEPEPDPRVEQDDPAAFEEDLGDQGEDGDDEEELKAEDETEGETEDEAETEKEVPPPLPLPEVTEPFDEADAPLGEFEEEAPEPTPAVDPLDSPLVEPSDAESLETAESSEASSRAFVGPPVEIVPTAPETSPSVEPSEPPRPPVAEDVVKPSSAEPGSILVPRSDSMWGVPAQEGRPRRRPSPRVREPGGEFEPARRSDALRTKPLLWTPRP